MFIKILFNYRGERTQGECVVRANGPDTDNVSTPRLVQHWTVNSSAINRLV